MFDVLQLFGVGADALAQYISLHVIACLVPAFFLAGAIASLFSKDSIMRLLGERAPRRLSYSVAAVSGCVLAVCSCTVLPIFGGILRRGAGIGPASTFLFSAPAINILAVIYTAQNLGFDIGLARAVAAVSLSVIIGLVMAFIFHERGDRSFNIDESVSKVVSNPGSSGVMSRSVLWIFILLVILLVVGGVGLDMLPKTLLMSLLIIIVIVIAWRYLSSEELRSWGGETWFLTKQIVPLLLAGVFFGAIIIDLIPIDVISYYLGGNSFAANGIASVSGTLMYFSTLTEVPIVGLLMKSGMGSGPALTMLLAGPALSLPSMVVIGRLMGLRRALIYICLVVVMAIMSGLIYGALL